MLYPTNKRPNLPYYLPYIQILHSDPTFTGKLLLP